MTRMAMPRRVNMTVITTRRTRAKRLLPAIIVGLLLGVAIGLGYFLWSGDSKPSVKKVSAGKPEAAVVSPQFPEFSSPSRAEVTPEQAASAIALNAATPSIPEQVVPARPFVFDPTATPDDRLRARDCLAAAVHYEAASEGVMGQRAVAQVVLNRVRSTAFPQTVCDVVFQGSMRTTGCQFTFTCDGALTRRPSELAWRRAQLVAGDALAGVVDPSVGTATHYHANWVTPYWRTSLVKLATVGTHIFYRWPGSFGERAAFTRSYRGGEMLYPQLVTAVGLTVIPALDPAALANAANLSAPLPKSPLPPTAAVTADVPGRRLNADETRGVLIETAPGALDPKR